MAEEVNYTPADKSFNQYMTDFELKLDETFGKKAPQLPTEAKEFIVKYGPIIAAIFLIISLPLLLTALGLGAIVAPFAFFGGAGAITGISFAMIFLAISLVVQALAIPLLMKRSIKGWRLMYYSTLVNAFYQLFSMNILGAILGAAIGFYFLFQVRQYYK